jgi:hypothetical protein
MFVPVKGPSFVEVWFSAAPCGLVAPASGKAWPVRAWRPSVDAIAAFPPTPSKFLSIKDHRPSPFFSLHLSNFPTRGPFLPPGSP